MVVMVVISYSSFLIEQTGDINNDVTQKEQGEQYRQY
jgi:hypothetical protein